MISLWNIIFYKPLANGLIFLISVVPWADVGIALILLTILVKILLFPLSQKSITSQARLQNLEPEIKKIKELYPDKTIQAQKTFELYKSYNVNPFSGCLLIIIQLPIIFALYKVFFDGLPFDSSIVYSFIHLPENYTTNFLGIIDMTAKSLPLALLAGISQFFQLKIAQPIQSNSAPDGSFQQEFMKSMNVQMKYVLPVLITFIAYKISAAIALYWVTSNVVTIIQEIIIRRRIKQTTTILEVKAVVK